MRKRSTTRVIRVSEKAWRTLKAQAEERDVSLRVFVDFFIFAERDTRVSRHKEKKHDTN